MRKRQKLRTKQPREGRAGSGFSATRRDRGPGLQAGVLAVRVVLRSGRRVRRRGVCAHGEDRVGGDGGADRALARGAGRARSSTSARRTTRLELEALKAAARQRLAGRAGRAGPRPGRTAVAGPGRSRCRSPPRRWRICGTRCAAPTTCSGSTAAAGGDEVFRQLVLARIIEPTSKLDTLRVLDEVGVEPPSYRDAQAPPAGLRRPRRGGSELAAACAAHAGAGAGVAGAVRRVDAVLRDRRR